MAPEAGGTPTNGPANINVTIPEPKRNFGWWLTTIGTVFVPVLALVLAVISLVYQNQANQRANQTAQQALALAARADAAAVSFTSVPNEPTHFVIQNREDNAITSVYIQPRASHESLTRIQPIKGCQGFTVSVPLATAPVMYFEDANGQGWEEPVNGIAEPFADPSALIVLLPSSAISAIPPAEGPPQTLTGC